MNNKNHVFVSHSSKDKDTARMIVAALHASGYQVWYDDENLELGPLKQQFDEHIRICQAFIVLLSPDAVASEWVRYEIETAQDWAATHGEPIMVPIVIKSCQVPAPFARYKYLDFTANASIVELLTLLKRTLESQRGAAPQPLAPAQPAAPANTKNVRIDKIGKRSTTIIQQGTSNTAHLPAADDAEE